MKISNVEQLNDLVAAVNECENQVWLDLSDGRCFGLKSLFSQYQAYKVILSEYDPCMHLRCASESDRRILNRYFVYHPEVC